jgi:pimeloyl-ACP methyl ester carboxylesterase
VPWITVADGTTLYYQDWGRGRPLVLLGAAMASSAAWEHQAVPLTEAGFRVVTYDRRGFGRSDRPWDGYDPDTLAGDLAAIIDHLGLEGVGLVGHAAGAVEITRYVASYGPQRVRRVALVCPTTPGPSVDAADPALEQQIGILRADRPARLTDFLAIYFDLAAEDADRAVSPEYARWTVDDVLAGSPRAAAQMMRLISTIDQRDELPRLTMPVLVIHGERDSVAPAELCALPTAELLPDAEVVAYQGAPHGLIVTHHAELTKELLTFFS